MKQGRTARKDFYTNRRLRLEFRKANLGRKRDRLVSEDTEITELMEKSKEI
jgi:hypothetical protein